MSKYGNGIGMKAMLEMEFDIIREAVKELPKEKQDIVLDAYKSLAYEWCSSNAYMCLTEEMLGEAIDQETLTKFWKLIYRMAVPYINEKMVDTYPWYEEEEQEE